MKKLLFLIAPFLICGCYTPAGIWFRSEFTMDCPNKYEKTVIKDSCNNETVKLKLEEHVWSSREQEIPERITLMKQKVFDEKLYINDICIGPWRGDTAIIVFASNVPTSMKDKAELGEHKLHMIREEKCDCRLCK
jgi:hypothetical protein